MDSLLQAAEVHDVKQCESLLLEGANANIRDPDTGDTPLHKAIHGGEDENARIRTIMCLKQRGADVLEPNHQQRTPIHTACARGLDMTVACLYDGTDSATRHTLLHCQDSLGNTPLLLAAKGGYKFLVMWLLREGAAVSVRDVEGNTALHVIAKYGEYWTAREMIRLSPSSCNIRNVSGYTAAGLAAHYAKQAWPPPQTANLYLIALRLQFPQIVSVSLGCDFIFWVAERGACLILPIVAAASAESLRSQMSSTNEEIGFMTVFFIILWSLIMILYVVLATCDPGNITETGAEHLSSESDSAILPRLSIRAKESKTYRSAYRIMLKHGCSQKERKFCTTCGIERPERSKHDQYTNNCVLRFDHFCPWVNNSVGAFNYPLYIAFIFLATFTSFVWIILFIKQVTRFPVTTWTFVFGIQPLWMGGFGIILILQHVRLMARNLTTNEAINFRKYHYLWDERQRFSNKYDCGSVGGNIMEVINLLRHWQLALHGSVRVISGICRRLRSSLHYFKNRVSRGRGKFAPPPTTKDRRGSSADHVNINVQPTQDTRSFSSPLYRQTSGPGDTSRGSWL